MPRWIAIFEDNPEASAGRARKKHAEDHFTSRSAPQPDIARSRGLDVDLNGVAWTVLSSGHPASFDRSKCKSPLAR
jgi:hypothetical protein